MTPLLDRILQTFQATASDLDTVLPFFNITSGQMMEQSLGYAIYQRQNFPESCEYVHIAQIENKQENIAYLFSPFILAVLQYKTSCYLPVSSELWLGHYLNIDNLHFIKQEKSLDEMGIFIQIAPQQLNSVQTKLYSLLRAFLDPKLRQLIFIDLQNYDDKNLKMLEQSLHAKIIYLPFSSSKLQITRSSLAGLLGKKKTQSAAEICELIAETNVELLSTLNNSLSINNNLKLIQDLLYSEHILEKISVYEEFIDTIFKHKTELTKRASYV